MSGTKKGEQFSSFQIGSMPGFGPGAKSAPKTSTSTPSSAPIQLPDAPAERYFPALEALIESDDQHIANFAQQMGNTCAELDELIQKRTGRIKQEAQMARKAYEHVFSLIDYLLEVKASLVSSQGSETSGQ